MEINFKIVGILLIILGLIHVGFPRYFNWKEELKQLSLINKQMMEIHTLFIAVVVLLIGLLCLFYSLELVNNPFGKTISLGLAIFWSLRLIIQFFGYSPELWRGKKFETITHFIFVLFWLYLSILFWTNYLS